MTFNEIYGMLQCYYRGDKPRFDALVKCIIANLRAKGKESQAHNLERLMTGSPTHGQLVTAKNLEKFIRPFEISTIEPVLNEKNKKFIEKIIHEYKNREQLINCGLPPASKILLVGASGTGKTLTATWFAGQIGLPFFKVGNIFECFLGDSIKNIINVLSFIKDVPGVYLFDEFDSIGYDRREKNETGEVRRVLSNFLEHIEYIPSESIIFATTNLYDKIDSALFRRFDHVLTFQNLNVFELETFLASKFGLLKNMEIAIDYKKIANVFTAKQLSPAIIEKICFETAKECCLKKKPIQDNDILQQIALEGIDNQ